MGDEGYIPGALYINSIWQECICDCPDMTRGEASDLIERLCRPLNVEYSFWQPISGSDSDIDIWEGTTLTAAADEDTNDANAPAYPESEELSEWLGNICIRKTETNDK